MEPLTKEVISTIKSLEKLVLEKISPTKSDLLTFDETSEFLNCTNGWLRKSIREKTIPFARLGRNIRFKKRELENWIEENSVKPV